MLNLNLAIGLSITTRRSSPPRLSFLSFKAFVGCGTGSCSCCPSSLELDVCYLDYVCFSLGVHFSNENGTYTRVGWGEMSTQSKLCMEPIVFIMFGVHAIILFVTKVKIFVLVTVSCRSCPIMFTVEPRMVGVFWARSAIYIKHMSFWCMLSNPHLITRIPSIGCLNYRCVGIIHVYLNIRLAILCALLLPRTTLGIESFGKYFIHLAIVDNEWYCRSKF